MPADAAAPAGALDSVQTFRNAATSACLHDSESGVRTCTCRGNDHQKWNVHRWADDTRELKNQATGLCLDDSFEHHLRTFARSGTGSSRRGCRRGDPSPASDGCRAPGHATSPPPRASRRRRMRTGHAGLGELDVSRWPGGAWSRSRG
ncbi:RICIN domain-containing protein [Streptomyces sp. NPDC002587]